MKTLIEARVEIVTAEGRMSTFVCHPDRNGPHPVIFFYMDAPGIREELRDMARRLASVGYYVLLPNLYYRSGEDELGSFAGAAGAPVRSKMMALMETLTIPMVMADTDALVAFAETDAAAQATHIGCVGYCMSGRYAMGAAVRHPDRVRAAASIFGTRLVTEGPDSPHVTAASMKARLYIGCAEHDDYMPLETVAEVSAALRGNDAEVEIYRGVGHGFAFPERGAFNKAAAERHWERLFALFGETLQTLDLRGSPSSGGM